jgi:hypothetical protein
MPYTECSKSLIKDIAFFGNICYNSAMHVVYYTPHVINVAGFQINLSAHDTQTHHVAYKTAIVTFNAIQLFRVKALAHLGINYQIKLKT